MLLNFIKNKNLPFGHEIAAGCVVGLVRTCGSLVFVGSASASSPIKANSLEW